MRGTKWLQWGWVRIALSLMIVAQLAAGSIGIASAAEGGVSGSGEPVVAAAKRDVSAEIAAAAKLLAEAKEQSDWGAFALARAGVAVPESYLAAAEAAVQASHGNAAKVTDLARIAIAVKAVGGNPQALTDAKIDLIAEIAAHAKMEVQGTNGPIFALLALDSGSYAGYDEAKAKLVKWILEHRIAKEGWSLLLTNGKSDVDVTAMALTALAAYKAQPEVKTAVDEALAWLSGKQQADGGYASGSESASQVVIALASLGIDPAADKAFVKANGSLLANVLSFRQADGGFAHVADGGTNGMATLQALQALTAYDRYAQGKPALFQKLQSKVAATVEIEGLSAVVAQGEAQGIVALDAVEQVLNASKVDYVVDTHPQFGKLLKGIGGVDNGKFGGYDGWMFAVKREGVWVSPDRGIADFEIQQGDVVKVYYSGDNTKLINSIEVKPVAPRAGQAFTVKVQQETFDWTANKLVVSPAVGAKVKVGPFFAVTDGTGTAKFDRAPIAGEYTVEVSGYQDGKAPTVVRDHTQLKVRDAVSAVTVRVEGDQAPVTAGSAKAANALNALEQALKGANVKYHVKDTQYGKIVDSINGIDNGKFGGYDGWQVIVKRGGVWDVPMVSVADYDVQDGDQIVFFYSNMSIVDAAAVSPEQPKPGQPFTVKVTKKAWDWEKNGFGDAVAAEGAVVEIGGKRVTADTYGVASFEGGVAEGVYTIAVTGYQDKAAPSFIRAVQELKVAGAYADAADVSAWAADAVTKARELGILRGVQDGGDTFAPQTNLTRAEFAAALARLFGLTPADAAATFTDVDGKAWYAGYVEAAKTAGIVKGVSATSFAPEAPITREQMAVMLANALKLDTTADAAAIKDAGKASKQAQGAIAAVYGAGLMTGSNGYFDPQGLVTREMAAVVAIRAYALRQAA